MALVILSDLEALKLELVRLVGAQGVTSNMVRLCLLTKPLPGESLPQQKCTFVATMVDAESGDIIRFERYIGRRWRNNVDGPEENKIVDDQYEKLLKETKEMVAELGFAAGNGIYLSGEFALQTL